MRKPQALTLADLLSEDHLGLELVVGGQASGSRLVSGAHSIELEHPARWLDRDWVMLTTGIGIHAQVAEQRALVAELDEAGVCALGFGLGVVHGELPEGLVEEARRRDFPLFTVPLRTPFREVIAFVYRSVLSTEIRASHRLAAMQRYLMDALAEERPREAVVQRLASLLDSTVGVLLPGGDFEVSTSDLPAAQIAAALSGKSSAAVSFAVAGLRGYALPIAATNGNGGRWLVIALPEARRPHPLTKPAAQATAPLLSAMGRLEHAQRAQDTAVRRATLDGLLELREREEGRFFAARAKALGIDISDGVAVLAVTDPTRRAGPAALLPAIERSLSHARIPFAATTRGDHVAGMLAMPADDSVLSERLLLHDAALRVGVGRTVTDPFDVRKSWLDAELAVGDSARRMHKRIVRYDDLDLATVLVNEVPLDRLAPKIEQWLKPLRENPLVHETLVSYFRHDLNVGRTARALQVHPNSVRYRLTRAEELIGAPLRSSATIVALHLVLMTNPTLSPHPDPAAPGGEAEPGEPPLP